MPKQRSVKSSATAGPSTSLSASAKPSKSAGGLQLGSFTVLPLILAQPQASGSSSAKDTARHYLYVRPDVTAVSSSMEAEADDRRTLFVANLPVDADEDKVRAVFGGVGAIEDVVFGGSAGSGKGKELFSLDDLVGEDDESSDDDDEAAAEEEAGGALELPSTRPRPPKPSKTSKRQAKAVTVTPLFADSLPTLLPSGSSTAKVTFLSALSLARALALPARPWPLSSPAGLNHLLRKHEALRPPLALVKAHADSSIAAFERLQAEERRRVTDKTAMVDDDGFTLVVRGGKYGKDAAGGGVGVASKRWESEWAEAEKAGGVNPKKKSKELKDFYRCVRVSPATAAATTSADHPLSWPRRAYSCLQVAGPRGQARGPRLHARQVRRRPEEGREASVEPAVHAVLMHAQSAHGNL
jgi:ribosomal RNA-processing protein 7